MHCPVLFLIKSLVMSVSQFVPDSPHIAGTETRAGQASLSEDRDVLTVLHVPGLVLQPLGVGSGEPHAQRGDQGREMFEVEDVVGNEGDERSRHHHVM